MIIAIQNTIGAIRSFLGIVVSGLKMFLPFSSSQQIGGELINDGDFSQGNAFWSTEAGWTINASAKTASYNGSSANNLLSQNRGLTTGQTYILSFTVANYQSGIVVAALSSGSLEGNTPNITANGDYSFTLIAKGVLCSFRSTSSFLGSIKNVSVKEVAQFSLDETTNNNNAKLLTGNTLEFDGAGDTVSLGSQSMPNSSAATITFWCNPVLSSSTGDRTVIRYGRTNVWFSNKNQLQVYPDVGGSAAVFSISDPSNKYQRFVVSISGTTSTLYINGVLIGSASSAAISTTAKPSFIASFNSDRFLPAKLSDIQLWNSAWSATDVANDYASPNQLVSSVSVSNLKGWWAITEGSGSTAYDSSGEGNNGTIIGATYTPAQSTILQLGMINWSNGSGVFLPSSPTNSAQDILGNAVRNRLNSLNLTGTGYGEVADSESINPTSAITIQCWIKSNTENNKGLVAKWNNSAQDYMLQKRSSQFRFYIGDTSLDSGTISTSGWVNLASTYDRLNMKTYINGQLSTTTNYSPSIPNNTNVLEIGRFNSQASLSYSERIDDVKIYNIALTADEVEQNYNAGASAHTN